MLTPSPRPHQAHPASENSSGPKCSFCGQILTPSHAAACPAFFDEAGARRSKKKEMGPWETEQVLYYRELAAKLNMPWDTPPMLLDRVAVARSRAAGARQRRHSDAKALQALTRLGVAGAAVVTAFVLLGKLDSDTLALWALPAICRLSYRKEDAAQAEEARSP